MISIYKITFNQYTNNVSKTVHNSLINHYRPTVNGELLITEYEINEMMNYGNGIRTMEFVGNIEFQDYEHGYDTFREKFLNIKPVNIEDKLKDIFEGE